MGAVVIPEKEVVEARDAAVSQPLSCAVRGYDVLRRPFPDGVLPDVFISDRLRLDDDEEALDRMRRGAGRKIQVLPGEQ